MVNINDPVTQWAFVILVSVIMGTFLLIAVAFMRRWQQIRYSRYVHALQRGYRPLVAKLLSGERNPAALEALRDLPLAELELLLDPIFSKRKLPERQLVFLQALCAELGLTALWQTRLANGHSRPGQPPALEAQCDVSDRAAVGYLLRGKSIRNLGILHHRPSWPLLVDALDDRRPDIQLVALRSVAAIGAPASFPMLQQRLNAVVQGTSPSPPLPALQAALSRFDLACAPGLLPSLQHPNHQIRLHATEILRAMVCREAHRQPRRASTQKLLTRPMADLLLNRLAADPSSGVRARAAEIIASLDDARAPSVLHRLLLDPQWLVRLRTVRALAHPRPHAQPPHLDIRKSLRDAHWRVREAAIRTLIILGREGKHHLYEHFLNSSDPTRRQQIVAVIQRTGLLSALVEEYGIGATGMDARMVEQVATDAVSVGRSGVLRSMNPEVHQKFLERFLLYTQSRMTPPLEARPVGKNAVDDHQILESSPPLAA